MRQPGGVERPVPLEERTTAGAAGERNDGLCARGAPSSADYDSGGGGRIAHLRQLGESRSNYPVAVRLAI